jgi:SNF2 family DNA or RNA helicase
VPGFQRQLKRYQVPAVSHAVSIAHSANFSVPGSGKTTIALAAYAILKGRGEIERLVVIGPRACFMPWEDEFEACFGRPAVSVRVSGSRDRRKSLYRVAEGADLVLLSYQMACNDRDDLAALLQRGKCLLVLDESHNVKRIEGGKWAEIVVELAPYATRRMILTGTPAPSSLLDLWSQFTFLWPNPPLLGRKENFRFKIEEHGSKPDAVKESLKPFFWRIKKSDLHLPAPIFHKVPVEMRIYQRRIYDAIGAKVLKDIVKAPSDRAKLRPWRRAKLIRLLQTASNPSLLSEYSVEFRIPPLDASDLPVDQLIERYSEFEVPAKLECAETLIRRLVRRGQKTVLWTTFVHNIKTLEIRLKDLNPLSIFGSVPKDDDENEEYNREQIIRRFKSSSSSPVLIANPGACAESVSLHKTCKHAVYLDRTFNGAQYLQSLDRIHRVGLSSRDRVHYYILEARDSVDAVIDERLEKKKVRMLELLDDDIPVMNLDTSPEAISDEGDDSADFNAVVVQLKKEYGPRQHGR